MVRDLESISRFSDQDDKLLGSLLLVLQSFSISPRRSSRLFYLACEYSFINSIDRLSIIRFVDIFGEKSLEETQLNDRACC